MTRLGNRPPVEGRVSIFKLNSSPLVWWVRYYHGQFGSTQPTAFTFINYRDDLQYRAFRSWQEAVDFVYPPNLYSEPS